MDEGQLSAYCTPKLGHWDEICSRDQEQQRSKRSVGPDLIQTQSIKHKLRSSQVSLMSSTVDLPGCVGKKKKLCRDTLVRKKFFTQRVVRLPSHHPLGSCGYILCFESHSQLLNAERGCLVWVSDLMRSGLAQSSSSWAYSAC